MAAEQQMLAVLRPFGSFAVKNLAADLFFQSSPGTAGDWSYKSIPGARAPHSACKMGTK